MSTEDDCSVCNKSTLRQARIKASGKVYHEQCFICSNCSQSLEAFFNVQGKLYCDDCEKNLFAKKCFKCSLPIESTVVTAKGKTFHNDCFRCGGCDCIIRGGFHYTNDLFFCNSCDGLTLYKKPSIQISPPSPPLPSRNSVTLTNGIEIQVPTNSTNIIYVVGANGTPSQPTSSQINSNNSTPPSPSVGRLNNSNYDMNTSSTSIGSSTALPTSPQIINGSNLLLNTNNGGITLNNLSNGSNSLSEPSSPFISTNNNSNNSGNTMLPGRLSNDYLATIQDDIYKQQQQQLIQLQQQQIQIQQQLQQQQLQLLQQIGSKSQIDSPSQSLKGSKEIESGLNGSNSFGRSSGNNLENKLSNLSISSTLSFTHSRNSSLSDDQSLSSSSSSIEKYIPKINGKTLTELLKYQSFEDILSEVLSKKINIYKELSKEEVHFGDVMGVGASGKVFKGTYRNRDVAIKVYSTDNFCFNTEEFNREITIMSLIDSDHPNFTRFYGANKQNPKYLFMVSELVKGGSLRDLLMDKEKPLTYFTQLSIALDISNAMKYLHSIGVIHRDLKSLNVLITEDYSAKVIDFGTSREIDVAKQMTLNLGTSSWMGPELFKNEPYTESCDVYAFGIVLWEIFCRKEPYEGVNSWSIPLMVAKGERPPIPSDMPSEYSKLMKACWADKPKKRPKFKEIHQTLKQMVENMTLKRSKK